MNNLEVQCTICRTIVEKYQPNIIIYFNFFTANIIRTTITFIGTLLPKIFLPIQTKEINLMKSIQQITTRQRFIEIGLVVLTGIGKIVVMDILNQKLPFILTVLLIWISYIFIRLRQVKGLSSYWGLSLASSKKLFKLLAPYAFFIIASIVAYGLFIKPIHWSIHIFFVLILYPIWGTMQQFLIMSLFAGNLQDQKTFNIAKPLIILLTSILFAIVHYPSLPLIVATFLMALIYSTLFLKYRNVIPLGIFHGIIGGLFYFVILNRDAWVEFVAKYV